MENLNENDRMNFEQSEYINKRDSQFLNPYYNATLKDTKTVNDTFCYCFFSTFVARTMLLVIGFYCVIKVANPETAYYSYVIPTIICLYLLSVFLCFISLIIDLVMVGKTGHNTVVLLLLGIFFVPAYFLWRSHILKSQKKIAIILTATFVCSTIIAIAFVTCALFIEFS